MCGVCGCGEAGHDHEDHHGHAHGPEHGHVHRRGQEGGPGDGRANAQLPVFAHAPGLSVHRMVQVERDLLAQNDRYAEDNRRSFAEQGIFALNLMSSPGSGKTTLLVRTIGTLREKGPVAVIEGDQQTDRDAQRIRATGVPVQQINTGRGCHLDAHRVAHACARMEVATGSTLFVENVGNLVCPAGFDLGEARRVVVLSVTEGEDKPLKYPDMFRIADVMVLNKVDLLPYVDFDVEACRAHARAINPHLSVLMVSATRGDGMDAWFSWLAAERAKWARQPAPVAEMAGR